MKYLPYSRSAIRSLTGLFAGAAMLAQAAPPMSVPMPMPMPAAPLSSTIHPSIFQNPVATPPPAGLGNAGAFSSNCTMTVSHATLNFGKIKAPAARNATGEFPVPAGQRATTLQIHCNRPTSFAVVLGGDARADNASFAFGAHGNAAISVRSGQVDGRNARFAQVDLPGQVPGDWHDQLAWRPGKALLVSSGSGSQPASQVQLELTVDAVFDGARIRPAATSRISSALTFDLVSL